MYQDALVVKPNSGWDDESIIAGIYKDWILQKLLLFILSDLFKRLIYKNAFLDRVDKYSVPIVRNFGQHYQTKNFINRLDCVVRVITA